MEHLTIIWRFFHHMNLLMFHMVIDKKISCVHFGYYQRRQGLVVCQCLVIYRKSSVCSCFPCVREENKYFCFSPLKLLNVLVARFRSKPCDCTIPIPFREYLESLNLALTCYSAFGFWSQIERIAMLLVLPTSFYNCLSISTSSQILSNLGFIGL